MPPPPLRRSFSTFPGGSPGLGLLLLRLTVGADLGFCSYAHLTPWQGADPFTIGTAALSVACAAAVVAGYRTAFSSVVAAILGVLAALSWLPASHLDSDATRVGSGFAAVMAIALACLGSGAFSIDALRYGHREIVIPTTSASEPEE